MAIDKEASRQWRRRIRDVLNRDWDPIGGCPANEYDAYVGKVAAMIREGASDDELFKYLNRAETIHMGGSGNRGRLKRVVAAIRALGPPDARKS